MLEAFKKVQDRLFDLVNREFKDKRGTGSPKENVQKMNFLDTNHKITLLPNYPITNKLKGKKMTQSKENKTELITLSIVLLLFYLISCSPPPPINDYFGIKMNPDDAKKFKIISYSEKDGASYHGNLTMDENIYAYAELTGKMFIIKVVNDSEKPVTTNFNTDHFTFLTADNKEFVLKKGRVTDYHSKSQIEPKSSMEYALQLPSNFWSSVGMRDANTMDADYQNEFWTGLNQLRLLKKDIKLLTLKLGSETTLILKPVPEGVK